PPYFSRIFKREVGRTVQQFIVDERLNKAESLMRGKELTLLEIAGLVGIRNQSLFNRMFRKRYGESPGEYRVKLQWKCINSARDSVEK
ncbi:MAG: helix-turn-helix transcriptional regulator, partial [Eubacteriales bacterium]|nr:helix-turn-helix transcriptional regulator [Eubacteriales bacterium]